MALDGKMGATGVKEPVPASGSGSDAEATTHGGVSPDEIHEKPQLPPAGKAIEGLPAKIEADAESGRKNTSSSKCFFVSSLPYAAVYAFREPTDIYSASSCTTTRRDGCSMSSPSSP